jgi:KipI family sensor histidine kinase inhibitor
VKTDDPADITFEPLGEEAVVALFGTALSVATNERACRFADAVIAARLDYVTDVVPSFVACTVHYSAALVPADDPLLPYDVVVQRLRRLASRMPKPGRSARTEPLEIPVCYGGEMGPDLDEAAQACGMTPDELVRVHANGPGARVFMIGFAPGAPYIGVHDERLGIRRRTSPRMAVPAGSIGIANRQTVIYPEQSPGGWNIVGRTPLRLFDLERVPVSLLKPGMPVRFRAIDQAEFDRLEQAAAHGA